MTLRVGLNLLHAVPDIGGGWNYIQNLLAALAEAPRRHEYVAFSTSVSATLVPKADNFRVMLMPVRAGSRAQRVLFEHTLLAGIARQQRVDCLHWFANGQGLFNACPAVVTVYDLQPFLDYAPMPAAKRWFLRRNLRRAVRRAARLLPMSDTTADALQERLGADRRRMTVIPPALEPVFEPASPEAAEAFRQRHGLADAFWLYVAHLYPHKNHERLLRAYRRLRDVSADAWPLVLRGDGRAHQWSRLERLIDELGLETHVRILPRLHRKELPALYGAASALVFPSLYEGAGIPVLEAQACGCPVLASNIPAVREFAGDAAAYINPLSEDDIARRMAGLAADGALRIRLRDQGLTRACEFRAISVADRLTDAYEQACR